MSDAIAECSCQSGWMCPSCVETLPSVNKLEEKINTYEKVLATISGMCIGKLTMGYDLDADAIGKLIYKVTKLTTEDLHRLHT